MIGCDGQRILTLGSDTYKVEEAGDFFCIVSKILGTGDQWNRAYVLLASHSRQTWYHPTGQIRIITHHWVTTGIDLKTSGRTVSLGRIHNDTLHTLQNICALQRLESTNCPDQFHFVRDDIVAYATFDGTHCDNRRICSDIRLPAYDCL